MDPDDGLPEYRIWLIGDSPPKNLHEKLAVPLDSRVHPTNRILRDEGEKVSIRSGGDTWPSKKAEGIRKHWLRF